MSLTTYRARLHAAAQAGLAALIALQVLAHLTTGRLASTAHDLTLLLGGVVLGLMGAKMLTFHRAKPLSPADEAQDGRE